MAKTRKELPYLPYPRQDVIQVINQHRFVAGDSPTLFYYDGATHDNATDVVIDAGPLGNNGIREPNAANGPQWLLSAGHWVLDWAAANRYVTTPVAVPAAFTIAAWVKKQGPAQGYVWADSQSPGNFLLQFIDGQFQSYVGSSIVFIGGDNTRDFHFAVSRSDDGTVRRYVDGALVSTTSATFGGVPAGRLWFGNRASLDRDYYGHIREMYLADSPLSAPQINSLMYGIVP